MIVRIIFVIAIIIFGCTNKIDQKISNDCLCNIEVYVEVKDEEYKNSPCILMVIKQTDSIPKARIHRFKTDQKQMINLNSNNYSWVEENDTIQLKLQTWFLDYDIDTNVICKNCDTIKLNIFVDEEY